jgi:uncharacterized membrane protein
MFESIPSDDAAARLRAATLPPFAAFLVALAYLTLYPLFTRVPPWLFWSIAAVLFTGTVLGFASIVRVVRRERIRGRAIAWLVAAIVVELLCTRLFLALTLPWL